MEGFQHPQRQVQLLGAGLAPGHVQLQVQAFKILVLLQGLLVDFLQLIGWFLPPASSQHSPIRNSFSVLNKVVFPRFILGQQTSHIVLYLQKKCKLIFTSLHFLRFV